MIVDWIIKRAQRRPYLHLAGYMNRWWFIKPRKWLPFAVRVHQILRSDSDRHLHDHPWNYVTIILRGGYWEVTRVDFNEYINTVRNSRTLTSTRRSQLYYDEEPEYYVHRWYGPGSVLFRRCTHAHRLELPAGNSSWSLFIMGPYRQGWGFYTRKGKVPWREYLSPAEVSEADDAHERDYQ